MLLARAAASSSLAAAAASYSSITRPSFRRFSMFLWHNAPFFRTADGDVRLVRRQHKPIKPVRVAKIKGGIAKLKTVRGVLMPNGMLRLYYGRYGMDFDNYWRECTEETRVELEYKRIRGLPGEYYCPRCDSRLLFLRRVEARYELVEVQAKRQVYHKVELGMPDPDNYRDFPREDRYFCQKVTCRVDEARINPSHNVSKVEILAGCISDKRYRKLRQGDKETPLLLREDVHPQVQGQKKAVVSEQEDEEEEDLEEDLDEDEIEFERREYERKIERSRSKSGLAQRKDAAEKTEKAREVARLIERMCANAPNRIREEIELEAAGLAPKMGHDEAMEIAMRNSEGRVTDNAELERYRRKGQHLRAVNAKTNKRIETVNKLLAKRGGPMHLSWQSKKDKRPFSAHYPPRTPRFPGQGAAPASDDDGDDNDDDDIAFSKFIESDASATPAFSGTPPYR